MVIYFVSLVLKALRSSQAFEVSSKDATLLVKASPRVYNTKPWFSRGHLLTRVSNYWESHRQFRSLGDLLSTAILPYSTNGFSHLTIVPLRAKASKFPNGVFHETALAIMGGY